MGCGGAAIVSAVNLYNFSPLVQLLILGGLVAIPPLAWVAWRSRGKSASDRLQTLSVVTLFLTFDLVLFGAFTRLTDSGLGCPDWPGCYGHASPSGAAEHIAQAESVLPAGPVTTGKAWVEMIHRYLASGVGAMILVSTVWAWIEHRRNRSSGMADANPLQHSPWWPSATLFWVCLQGAFGAWTVTMKLFPLIVTLHLMGGMVLLGLLRWQSLGVHRSDVAWSLRPAIGAMLALTAMQILLGGWVSTNYAVMACSEFPACQGSWWPDMDFKAGFEAWRHLGQTGDGTALPFQALTAIHYTHRLAAYLVLAGIIWLALMLRRWPSQSSTSNALLGLAAWQLVTGLSNVLLGWPLLGAVGHTGGAAALVVVLTGLLHSSKAPSPADRTQSQTQLAHRHPIQTGGMA